MELLIRVKFNQQFRKKLFILLYFIFKS